MLFFSINNAPFRWNIYVFETLAAQADTAFNFTLTLEAYSHKEAHRNSSSYYPNVLQLLINSNSSEN